MCVFLNLLFGGKSWSFGFLGENQCIENFENTAAFSRDYQSAQECMCDSEHMIECPNSVDEDNSVVPGMPITNADFDQIVERFEV